MARKMDKREYMRFRKSIEEEKSAADDGWSGNPLEKGVFFLVNGSYAFQVRDGVSETQQ